MNHRQSGRELLDSVLTCDLGDALQGGNREGEDDALTGPHPQQALAGQQAGDANLTWNTNRHSTVTTAYTARAKVLPPPNQDLSVTVQQNTGWQLIVFIKWRSQRRGPLMST